MSRMIFIYTGKLADDPRAGSAVRPVRMLEAFKGIGYEVVEVSGHSGDRKREYRRLRSAIRNGTSFEFCYLETTTMPMALGDPGHLPARPFLDIRFLEFLKENGIPVFPYYRDARWAEPTYGKRLGFLRRVAALWFYRFEFGRLCRCARTLYLPSSGLKKYLPSLDFPAEVLPPGCIPDPLPSPPLDGVLRILYVGGVSGPVYDLGELLEVVRGDGDLKLVVVCRKEESAKLRGLCAGIPNVRIINKTAGEVAEEYAGAHIASVFLAPTEYFSIAMPVKLFEAVGYGVPLLARSGTAAGEFVEREGLGWVADGPAQALEFLRRLRERPAELEAARLRVREASARHSWTERARQVARAANPGRAGSIGSRSSKIGSGKE